MAACLSTSVPRSPRSGVSIGEVWKMRTGACTDSRSRVLRMFSALALYQEVALDTGFRTSRLLSFQVPDWRRTRPSSMGELTVAAMASAFARERARKTRRARGRAGHRPGRPSPAVQWVTDVRFPATRGRCRSPHDAGQRDENSAHGEVTVEVELVSTMWHACQTHSSIQTASVRARFASPSAPSSAAPTSAVAEQRRAPQPRAGPGP